MTLIHEFAPAKINLYLHVTGRRDDGYHDLDSLVAFASIGDEIGLRAAEGFRFAITGPQASVLEGDDPHDNLAVKAAEALAALVGRKLDVQLVLVKNLPVASGIGGGSSDAAATLRALARHWGLAADDPRLAQAAAQLGQDILVCLKVESTYITATGRDSAPSLPLTPIVLANPGKGLATPAVYKECRALAAAFSTQARLAQAPQSTEELVAELKLRGNDLYAPACRLMPEIAGVVEVLQHSKGCLFARMSGSGATCFGIFPDEVAAKSAAAQIRAIRPRWWVEAGTTINA